MEFKIATLFSLGFWQQLINLMTFPVSVSDQHLNRRKKNPNLAEDQDSRTFFNIVQITSFGLFGIVNYIRKIRIRGNSTLPNLLKLVSEVHVPASKHAPNPFSFSFVCVCVGSVVEVEDEVGSNSVLVFSNLQRVMLETYHYHFYLDLLLISICIYRKIMNKLD